MYGILCIYIIFLNIEWGILELSPKIDFVNMIWVFKPRQGFFSVAKQVVTIIKETF